MDLLSFVRHGIKLIEEEDAKLIASLRQLEEECREIGRRRGAIVVELAELRAAEKVLLRWKEDEGSSQRSPSAS